MSVWERIRRGSNRKAHHNKAMLVVDVDYRDGWTPEIIAKSHDRQQAASAITKRVLWARQNNIPVIFIMLESNPNRKLQLSAESSCLGCDRGKNKLPDFLGHRHGEEFEPVFVKEFTDAFTNPNLSVYLRKIKAEELLLVGCDTFLCVLATACGAVKDGFSVSLIENAAYPPFANNDKKQEWLDKVRSQRSKQEGAVAIIN